MIGKTPWHEVPDEYGGPDEDALAHAFSLDYIADDLPDYMNDEQELYDQQSAEEDAEWEET